MSIAETEALKRWCPFARVAAGRPAGPDRFIITVGPPSFNRIAEATESAGVLAGNCIGARCMAWRTAGLVEARETVDLVGLARKRVTHVHERTGYCGLAGPAGQTDAEVLAQAQGEEA